ncbi:hypothetical protein [Candidatus Sororendozoicomonas aggregata]|uniref:hypothetical protein n=1 Tax=Candidatus Sororendozoicomonas aggregata TaxID=3073239 RepID=UPI002ED553A2
MIKLLLVIAVLANCSCGYFSSPHEIFKSHMSTTIGKHISDPHTWARPDRFISARVLKGGNIENKYKLQKSCFYFFEEDKSTGIIVKWRFEGEVKDCVISP